MRFEQSGVAQQCGNRARLAFPLACDSARTPGCFAGAARGRQLSAPHGAPFGVPQSACSCDDDGIVKSNMDNAFDDEANAVFVLVDGARVTDVGRGLGGGLPVHCTVQSAPPSSSSSFAQAWSALMLSTSASARQIRSSIPSR